MMILSFNLSPQRAGVIYDRFPPTARTKIGCCLCILKTHFFTTLVLALCAAPALIASFLNSLSCSCICTSTHEPSLFRRSSDGTRFRLVVGGSIDFCSSPTAQGPCVYVGVLLADGSSIYKSGSEHAWASDVHETHGAAFIISPKSTQEARATSPSCRPIRGQAHVSPAHSVDAPRYLNSSDRHESTLGSFRLLVTVLCSRTLRVECPCRCSLAYIDGCFDACS